MRLSKLTLVGGLFAVLFLAPACGPERGSGVIALIRNPNQTSYAYATFFPRPLADCSSSKVGGCDVQECVPTGAGVEHASAGLLRVTGGHPKDGVTFVGQDPTCFPGCNAYAVTTPSGAWWEGGETLTAFAPGAGVPAFSASVTAPRAITVTAPICDELAGCNVSRASDLTVSWTGGEATSVRASFQSLSLTRSVNIDCRFASSPGTIGAAVLAKLGSSEDGFDNTLRIYGANRTTFAAGDYDVALEANNLELMSVVKTSN